MGLIKQLKGIQAELKSSCCWRSSTSGLQSQLLLELLGFHMTCLQILDCPIHNHIIKEANLSLYIGLCALSHSSRVQLFMTPWTTAARFLCPWGFSRKKILEWVATPFSRESSRPEIEPLSLTSPALAGRFFTTSTTTCAYVWMDMYMFYGGTLVDTIPQHLVNEC